MTRISALSCDETKTIIDTLSRHDLLGKARVDKLAATILDKAAVDECCKPKLDVAEVPAALLADAVVASHVAASGWHTLAVGGCRCSAPT